MDYKNRLIQAMKNAAQAAQMDEEAHKLIAELERYGVNLKDIKFSMTYLYSKI